MSEVPTPEPERKPPHPDEKRAPQPIGDPPSRKPPLEEPLDPQPKGDPPAQPEPEGDPPSKSEAAQLPPGRLARLRSHWVVRLVALVAVFVVVAVVYSLTLLQIVGTFTEITGLLGVTLAAAAALALVTPLFEGRSLAAIGLGWRGSVQEWLSGLGLGVAYISACIGVLALLGVYRVEGVRFAWAALGGALLVQVLVGLWEELVFRGIVFRLLEEGLGSWVALLLSGALFGAVHITNPDATAWGATAIAIEAGLFLGAAYMLTRSLWFVAGIHTAWNFVQGPIYGSPISGTGDVPYSLLDANFVGPELLTGGQFGVEASIVAVLLGLALGVWFTVRATRRRRTLRPLLWRPGVSRLAAE